MSLLTLTPQDLYNQEFRSTKGETRYNCIYCSDTKFHMYVNISKGVFHCFKCGAKGIYVNREKIEEIDNFTSKIQRYKKKEEIINFHNEKLVKSLPITIHHQHFTY
jgi:transcription elongation factor Elf1